MAMQTRVFIYGVPGTGKTSFSKRLGKRLRIPILEADTIKRKIRKNKPRDQFPFLYLATCKAYAIFGKLTMENAMKGMLAVRNALREAVIDEVKYRGDLILEGAFLDPVSLKKFGKVVLLTTMDESRHRRQFLRHREKLLDITMSEFRAARMVQEYLIEEAQRLGVDILDNDRDLETLAEQIKPERS